jgi:hypothetical protein
MLVHQFIGTSDGHLRYMVHTEDHSMRLVAEDNVPLLSSHLTGTLRHGPISECTLAEPEKAYTPGINDSDDYHFIAGFEGHERVRSAGRGYRL